MRDYNPPNKVEDLEIQNNPYNIGSKYEIINAREMALPLEDYKDGDIVEASKLLYTHLMQDTRGFYFNAAWLTRGYLKELQDDGLLR